MLKILAAKRELLYTGQGEGRENRKSEGVDGDRTHTQHVQALGLIPRMGLNKEG